MADKNDARLIIQAARLKALGHAPYLATAMWNVHMQPCNHPALKGTMGVSKNWILYYDPEITKKWKVDEIAAVLIHEIWHLLRVHSSRAEAQGISNPGNPLDQQIKSVVWNIAADCEINDDLDKEYLKLPTGKMTPQAFGMTPYEMAEVYYQQLLHNTKIKKGKMEGGGEGSGVTNIPQEWEASESEANGKDGQATTKGLNAMEAEIVRQRVAHDICKQAGNVPDHAKRWADTQLKPKINWQQLLASAIRNSIVWSSGMSDYTYSRPSRRSQAVPRVILPSLKGPIPRIAIVIDTSGSMQKEELQQALAETKGILESVQTSVIVFAVDCEVHKRQSVFSANEIELVGGGGTDMGEGLEAAAKESPNIVIVFTDMYTPWPESKPRGLGKVIVCGISSGSYRWSGGRSSCPSWAEYIEVNNADSEN